MNYLKKHEWQTNSWTVQVCCDKCHICGNELIGKIKLGNLKCLNNHD